MSLVEAECRYAIAVAYAEWHWGKGREGPFDASRYNAALGFNILEYERDLGPDPPF